MSFIISISIVIYYYFTYSKVQKKIEACLCFPSIQWLVSTRFRSICTSNYWLKTFSRSIAHVQYQQWQFSSRLRCNLSAWIAAKLWRVENSANQTWNELKKIFSPPAVHIQLILKADFVLKSIRLFSLSSRVLKPRLCCWPNSLGAAHKSVSFFWDGTKFNPFPRLLLFFSLSLGSLIWIEFFSPFYIRMKTIIMMETMTS